VILRPKKLEIEKKKICKRATKEKKEEIIECQDIKPNPSKDKSYMRGS
jgi:hypothetical protein